MTKINNLYKCDDEKALYAKNQGILMRFLTLNLRLRLKKFILIIKDPKPFFIRKFIILFVLRQKKNIQSISKNGVTKLNGENLPEFGNIFSYWSERSKKLIDIQKLNNTKYSKNLLDEIEILRHSPTINFALSHELLSVIGEYLGTSPSLHSINLWWGKAEEPRAGSPFFHLDSLDSSCILLYVYLSDVADNNGPFCVIPRNESLKFIKKTGYLGNSLSDESVFKILPTSSLKKLTGQAGSIFAIDATNSLHYGSRCKDGDRVALIFSYASYHNDEMTADFLKSLPKLKNPTLLQKMAYEHLSCK
tara:strand:+ start:66 stop:980 length:915 start_codon:yes stop_codon:yes gene_type:complete